MVSFPRMRIPSRADIFDPYVRYDKFNPAVSENKDARNSLAGLDYSPLRRVTLASFLMGILVSMGGFV